MHSNDLEKPKLDQYTCRIKTDAEGANAKIIALTAHAFEKDREKIMAAGCDDFIRKPFQETDIFNTLQKHLGVEYIYAEQKASFAAESENRIDKQVLAALPS